MLYIQYIQGNCNPQQVVQGSGPDFRLERNPMDAAKKVFPIVRILHVVFLLYVIARVSLFVFEPGYHTDFHYFAFL